MSSAPSPAGFGYQNVRTRQDWKQSSRKRIFAGSLWTRMACSLANRARVGRFMRLVTPLLAPRRLRGILTQADKSGARTKVIRATQHTGSFIATSASILPWSIWAPSGAGAESFPACKITGSPDTVLRTSCIIAQRRNVRRRNMPLTLSNSAASNFAKSATWDLIHLSSLPSMPNYLGIGGSKDRGSSRNLYDRPQIKGNFHSPHRANT